MQEGKRALSPEEIERGQPQFSWQSEDAASHWTQQSGWRENLFGEATRLMLEAAELGEGYHVLDIAAGTGDQSLFAARKVGPTGTVLATDISAEMLKEAARLLPTNPKQPGDQRDGTTQATRSAAFTGRSRASIAPV